MKSYFKAISYTIGTWWLKRTLMKNEFTISGYKDTCIRILGKRHLDDWEVDLVHMWKMQGKIVSTGGHTIVSPSTNRSYSYQTFKVKA